MELDKHGDFADWSQIMTSVLIPGKVILLEAKSPMERRREWRSWKQKGYRVPAKDGIAVWHEREAIKHMVLEAFSDCDADVFLFGSRATRKAREHSDYDVGYNADHSPNPSRLAKLKEELEDLPIPSHVDLVDFREVPDEFFNMVFKKRREIEIWKKKPGNSIFT